jgi:hypothetical protein
LFHRHKELLNTWSDEHNLKAEDLTKLNAGEGLIANPLREVEAELRKARLLIGALCEQAVAHRLARLCEVVRVSEPNTELSGGLGGWLTDA